MSLIKQLAEQLHKSVIKNFKRRKVYARFKDSIWVADLAEIESLSLKNENIKYSLCLIDKNRKTVPNAFIKIVTESNRKRNKI